MRSSPAARRAAPRSGRGITSRPSVAEAGIVAAACVGSALAVAAATELAPHNGVAAVSIAVGAAGAVAVSLAVVVGRGNERVGRTAAARQAAIIGSAAFAASRFAQDESVAGAIDEVLRRLGETTGADRVYVYENSLDADGRLMMSLRHEWRRDGVPWSTEDDAQRSSYADGFMHWARKLGDGRPVQVLRSDATGTERESMLADGSLSVAAVPVEVAGEWWGFLGVEDVHEELPWSETDVAALTVAAAALGVALANERWMRELAVAEERFRVLVEQAPAVAYIDAVDDRATSLYMSPQIETLTGFAPDEWTADPDLWQRMLHPEDRDRVLAEQREHNASGAPFSSEYRLLTKDGGEVWVRDTAVMILGDDGSFRYSQGVMQDITAQRSVDQTIAELAFHDRLTGVANLAMFRRLADGALARAQQSDQALAVLSVDVDGFKLANDSLGIAGGDDLLRQLAQRIELTIRDEDTLARRGADEFLVLLPNLDRGVEDVNAAMIFAESIAQRLRDAIRQPFDIEGQEAFVSASIGISVFPDDAEDVDELLVHAEQAMRDTKREGPGGYRAYGGGILDPATTFAFVTKLRRAVERREWTLVYQPLVRLDGGAVHGVEALLRWTGESGEIVSPAEFIPLAEDLGLIEDIGEWVLEELCRQHQAWRAEHLRLEIGFNLSPRQFWQPDLGARVAATLERGGVIPSDIMVEVTETSAMSDPDRALAVLHGLRSRGLKVSLDDFGTGYSSLSRLRSLPVDVLKIDRSFVTGVDVDPQAAEIVSAFIQLGHGLGMTTLAEGIETEGESRFLATHGCDLGQGFYFFRPLPAEEISRRWLAGELTLASGERPPRPEGYREVARVWRPGHA